MNKSSTTVSFKYSGALRFLLILEVVDIAIKPKLLNYKLFSSPMIHYVHVQYFNKKEQLGVIIQMVSRCLSRLV